MFKSDRMRSQVKSYICWLHKWSALDAFISPKNTNRLFYKLGLTHSSKICDAKLSCAIIEDNGLSTGFTIVHEISHK